MDSFSALSRESQASCAFTLRWPDWLTSASPGFAERGGQPGRVPAGLQERLLGRRASTGALAGGSLSESLDALSASPTQLALLQLPRQLHEDLHEHVFLVRRASPSWRTQSLSRPQEMLELRELNVARALLRQADVLSALRTSEPGRHARLENLLSLPHFDAHAAWPAAGGREARRGSLAAAVSAELVTAPPSRLLALLGQALKWQQHTGLLPQDTAFDLFRGVAPSQRDEADVPATRAPPCDDVTFQPLTRRPQWSSALCASASPRTRRARASAPTARRACLHEATLFCSSLGWDSSSSSPAPPTASSSSGTPPAAHSAATWPTRLMAPS